MKTVIAMCGLAGSGKDTSADYLVAKHGFKKTSFAAPLKQMAKIAFGFTDEQLYGSSSKREEENTKYPFSGTCLKCNSQCQLAFVSKHGHSPYYCPNCKMEYPAFINARIALQTLGTEWGRRLSADIWAKAAINQILSSDHNLWCISDLRFVNELEAVQKLAIPDAKGYTVRLMRGALTSTHASEAELVSIPIGQFDFVIDNKGTLDELFAELDVVMGKL